MWSYNEELDIISYYMYFIQLIQIKKFNKVQWKTGLILM